jgi:hypothetical protein
MGSGVESGNGSGGRERRDGLAGMSSVSVSAMQSRAGAHSDTDG